MRQGKPKQTNEIQLDRYFKNLISLLCFQKPAQIQFKNSDLDNLELRQITVLLESIVF